MDVSLIRRDGSQARQLSDFNGCICLMATWSPNSQAVIFSTERGRGDPDRPQNFNLFEIYRVGIDGSQPEQLTRTGIIKYSRGWSPDGEWLMFHNIDAVSRFRIFGLNMLTGEQKQFTEPGENYFWGWAGDSMIIDYGLPDGGHIVSIEPDSGDSVTLAPDGRVEYVTDDWIYYLAGTENADIFRVHPDAGDRQQLTQGGTFTHIIDEIPAVDLPYSPLWIFLAGGLMLSAAAIPSRIIMFRRRQEITAERIVTA